MIWQVKHITVYLADEHGLPSRPYHLLVARNALVHNQVKYFVSNAPPGTLSGLPVSNRRKVGTTSSHHGLYAQGLTRATMAATERRETVRWSRDREVEPRTN